MRKTFFMLQHLLLVLLLAAMTGCGANNAGTGTSAAPGSVTAKLTWSNGTKLAKAKATSSIPSNVANVVFTVTGTGTNGPIPVVKTTVAAANSASGSIPGIYPGTVAVAVKALDSTGAMVYEGYAINLDVAPNATTNAGTINMTVPIVKSEEVPCLGCHETTLDLTGQSVVANYKQSGHYTNTTFQDANGQGAGCVGCHGPSHNIPDPSANGTQARCFDCHNINNTNTQLVANHGNYYFNNGTECSACHQVHNTLAGNMERKTWAQSAHGSTDFARLAGGGSGCSTRCHNAAGFIAAMANPTKVVGGTMTAQDQMVTCNACHSNAPLGKIRNLPGTSASAFRAYTTSNPGYGFAPYNKLNPNKKAYYPDMAGSNVCIVCHAGTTEGSATSFGCSDPYFANSTSALKLKRSSTISQHNMPSAAVMYVKFGFMNLSTGVTGVTSNAYLNGLTSDQDPGYGQAVGGIGSTHRKLGTNAIHGDSHNPSFFVPGNLDSNGPCATCHVTGSHSFRIDQAAINAVCSNCHTSENGQAIATQAAFEQFFLDPQKEVYNNAIALGATVVNKKIADYNAALTSTPNALGYSTTNPLQFLVAINPFTSVQPGKLSFVKFLEPAGNATYPTYDPTEGTIFTASSSTTSSTYAAPGTTYANYLAPAATTYPYYSTDWTNTAIALGYSQSAGDAGYTKFVGALSNLAFFAKDQGGFAHARTYSRRLIYDSIDFLDNGKLDMSVSGTATAISAISGNVNGIANPVAGLYTKGSTAYTNGTLTVLANGTTESMLYLVGWSRSTGAWSSPERP
ncbi:NapC/NirT family cytochrome c [Geomonas sp. Red32]|uniref:NapC/NirT family cytochrome c n=1 Tax=Geomonas sp. Red32 TaxID=2912856 RepID=UPI00202CF1C7|nr:NapC/NirT family cytochrome c [Geomonas sp. Red32]MCM0082544.1 NapC/NirT family cytochrome c [Geomonas sp. Red32]